MRKFSSEYNLDIQEVYRRFILKEFAQMISHSNYKEKLISFGATKLIILKLFWYNERYY